jgi:hypothetical protein
MRRLALGAAPISAMALALATVTPTSVALLEGEAAAIPSQLAPACSSEIAQQALVKALRRRSYVDRRGAAVTWSTERTLAPNGAESFVVVTNGYANNVTLRQLSGTRSVYLTTCAYSAPGGQPGDALPSVVSKLSFEGADYGEVSPRIPLHLAAFRKAPSGRDYVILYLVTTVDRADSGGEVKLDAVLKTG